MMINIRYVELTAKELFYLPLNGIFLIVPLSLEIALYFYVSTPFNAENFESAVPLTQSLFSFTNMEVLGYLLYNPRYTWIVFLSALILLVAMVGAIALTLTKRFDVRRQSIFEQLTRTVDQSLRLAHSVKNT